MANSLSIVLPNDPTRSISMQQFLQYVQQVTAAGTQYGATSSRPTAGLYIGMPYFDTTLQELVTYTGSGWTSPAIPFNTTPFQSISALATTATLPQVITAFNQVLAALQAQ